MQQWKDFVALATIILMWSASISMAIATFVVFGLAFACVNRILAQRFFYEVW